MDVQALIELRDKVKADAFRDNGTDRFSALNGGYGVKIDHQAATARDAHFGCLKSAQKLHEALLPDEGWEIARTAKYPGMIPGSSRHPFRAYVGWSKGYYGEADNPARAWLIAILSALIAREATSTTGGE